ncbi:hypothetical protein PR048_004166 [Dryococelus australis]|uniref:Uncharacterized protein n=1 Tax=Dryococelus australis TaxID=614101 RepID=A0ABQ9I6N0_9NEOP|nr:hypothetical protein PR048_004166 [Dryococelus australis]
MCLAGWSNVAGKPVEWDQHLVRMRQSEHWRLMTLYQLLFNRHQHVEHVILHSQCIARVDGTPVFAYNYAATQHLQPVDLPHRVQFCQWLLQHEAG